MRIWLNIALYVCLFSGCTQQRDTQKITVVEVNGHHLTAVDFAQRLAKKLKAFDVLKTKNPQNITRVKNQVIYEFIHEILITQWTQQQGLKVTPYEVQQQIDILRGEYPNDIVFRQSLVESGQTLETLKKELQKRLLEEKFFRHIREGINPPTTQDMASYYKANQALFRQEARVEVQHILFKSKSEAQGLHKKLKSLSQKSLNASKPLIHQKVWIEKGADNVFEKAFSMKKRAWSEVIQSPHGYHIYRVLRKKPNRQLTFGQAQDKIQRILMAQKEQASYSAWLEQQVGNLQVLRNEEVISNLQVESQSVMNVVTR